MQDVAHQHDVGLGERIGEEAALGEGQPAGEAEAGDVLGEDRADRFEVEPLAGQVRVGQGNLRGEIALRRADVDEGAVRRPRQLGRDGHVGAAAQAGHRLEELLQAGGVGVEAFEQALHTVLDFVLRQAVLERLGEIAPEAIQARVGHFEDAADVRRLPAIQEEIGGRRVRVAAVGPAQEAQRHQRVEEVAGAARMEAEPRPQALQGLGAAGQLGEHAELDGAEEGLGRPEGEPGLEDGVGGRGLGHGWPRVYRRKPLRLRGPTASATIIRPSPGPFCMGRYRAPAVSSCWGASRRSRLPAA